MSHVHDRAERYAKRFQRQGKKAKAQRREVGYDEYLNSPEWRRKRRAAVEKAGGQCSRCRSKKNLTVHHVTYKRFGREKSRDLQVLCRPCHDDEHLANILGIGVEDLPAWRAERFAAKAVAENLASDWQDRKRAYSTKPAKT